MGSPGVSPSLAFLISPPARFCQAGIFCDRGNRFHFHYRRTTAPATLLHPFVLPTQRPLTPRRCLLRSIEVTLLLSPSCKRLLQCFSPSIGHLHIRLSHWRVTLRCSTSPPQVRKEPRVGFDSSATPPRRPCIYCQGQSLVDARKQLPPQSV